ncbi:MAG: lipid-A-disaccharide synthase [Bacteroidaceae bacterium]|nr:lipid-A-disaccharide synthase [Bacteroidaceae bacterium]
MKYYLIAGEASGDLHASHLIAALKAEDPQAQFRGFGGDLMEAEGMTLVRHYRDLAYMGIVAVALHARTILKGMRQCKEDIVAWEPDVVILVDYPGFNLKIAKFVHDRALCPVYYYIAPKLWAWKEYRIKGIRRNVDEIFSILPFEVDFFEKKHGYPIHYVGNPTVDEVADFRLTPSALGKSSIALLCGSRTHEIRDNLPRMLAAAEPFADSYRLVIAGAPGIEPDYYNKYVGHHKVEIVYGQTYQLLSEATAALVTSGTATLETALFRVPQVVCYFMQARQLASLLRKILIKVPYISLVNLVAGREVVPELVADHMTVSACHAHLESILPGGSAREAQLAGYEDMARRLGKPGAPQRAAALIKSLLTSSKNAHSIEE